jgi:hypothetical protein
MIKRNRSPVESALGRIRRVARAYTRPANLAANTPMELRLASAQAVSPDVRWENALNTHFVFVWNHSEHALRFFAKRC